MFAPHFYEVPYTWKKKLSFCLWYHLNSCPALSQLCSSSLIVASLFHCKQHNMSLCKCALTNDFCPATVSGVHRFLQSRRKCQQIHQHAEVVLNFRARGSGALHTTVTVLPYLQEAKSLSGCSFNEGTVGQFCNYWHRESFKNLILNTFIDCTVLHTKTAVCSVLYLCERICSPCWPIGPHLK